MGASQKAWYQKNKLKQRALNDRWKRENPERWALIQLRSALKKYGLTPEEYQALMITQDGKCAICGLAHDRLDVDHHHDSGRIRGLLCRRCNTTLGLVNEDPALLGKMRSYLR